MVYQGRNKMVVYEEKDGRYHVTRFVTQGNWENVCSYWFDSMDDLKKWADS